MSFETKDSSPDSIQEKNTSRVTELTKKINGWSYSGNPENPLEIYTEYRLTRSPIKWFWIGSKFLDSLGENRGIERQLPENRVPLNFIHVLRLAALWFGACCSLPSMVGFFLGPTMFGLSFKASVSSGVLGAFVGSIVGAFGAVFGPRSGLRQMMGTRFQFGWWFSKFLCLLTCCTSIGWLMVNGFFGGQLINALSNNTVSQQAGIGILFAVMFVLTVFGQRYLAYFDSFFIIPLFVAFLLCYVCTGHTFVTDQVSTVTGVNQRAAWVTNFQTCIGITSTWLPLASDYHLDMPEKTNKLAVYLGVLAVMFIPTAFVGILGCGLASAAAWDPVLSEIYKTQGGAGLIVDGMQRWHGGGKFLVALMYISLITNGGMTVYSFGISFQTLGIPLARFPRFTFVIFGSVLWYVLTAVGLDSWSEVVANFLPMIGYWSMIYFTILAIETLWFRRKPKDEYDWDQYLNPSHFPMPYAAILSFGFGVAGVVLGMYQYYYTGRLARLIGDSCELGTFLAVGFSGISYPPLRYLEIRWRNQPKITP